MKAEMIAAVICLLSLMALEDPKTNGGFNTSTNLGGGKCLSSSLISHVLADDGLICWCVLCHTIE